MSDEPQEGFVVRDRRRFLSDVEAPTAPTPPAAPPASPTPTVPAAPFGVEDDDAPLDAAQFAALMNQMAAQQGIQGFADEAGMSASEPGGAGLADYEGAEGGAGDETALPDIYSVLVMFLNEMRSHSLLRLGLVPNPVTGQSEQDLVQARVAINTLGFLVGELEPVVAPEERLPLRAMVSDLQLQFARQSQAGQ